MSFPQLLTTRRLGELGAQGKIEEALNRKIENALVNDCFHSTTIELPKSFTHRISRCQDFVAVLNLNDTNKKIALWSLRTQCKLWDLDITSKFEDLKITNSYLKSNTSHCQLSEQGMILVDLSSTKSKIILLNGKQSGKLPKLFWHSIHLLGTRILGHWIEPRNPSSSDPLWLPENINSFFGEYDEKGNSLNRYQLDSTPGQWTHLYAYDENYWIRLSTRGTNSLASIIEVVDRVIEKMTTYTLLLSPEVEQISSACLARDRLFYGKSTIRLGRYNNEIHCEPAIGIFDLVKGKIIEEFPTGSKNGTPVNLVATSHYAAWVDYLRGADHPVKYLDVFNKIIKVGATVPHCMTNEKVILNIFGTTLSVIYAEGFLMYGKGPFWRRKVIDMTNGELKCDVRYKRVPWGDCSIENGNLLITDRYSNPASMYIESFADERIPNQESAFRDSVEKF